MPRPSETERVSQLLFYGSVLLIAWLAYRIVEPFLVEIGWALVLAVCLDPFRVRLWPRLGPTRTALLLTFSVVVLLVIPVVFVGTTLVTEGGPAVSYLEAQLRNQAGPSVWLHDAWKWLRDQAPMLPPEEEAIAKVTEGIGAAAQFVASRAGGVLRGLVSFLFSLGITLVMLFFLIRDWSALAAGFERVLPFEPEQNTRLLAISRAMVSASVTATLSIAAIQGLIGGATFAILGIPGAVVWGAMIGFLALLPMVGATLVWLPAGVWLVLSGSVADGVILLLVGVLVLGNVDNVVRPLLLSGTSQLSTPVLIISLLGGLSAFGFIGIVAGPLVASLLTALVESYRSPLAPAEARLPAAEPSDEGSSSSTGRPEAPSSGSTVESAPAAKAADDEPPDPALR